MQFEKLKSILKQYCEKKAESDQKLQEEKEERKRKEEASNARKAAEKGGEAAQENEQESKQRKDEQAATKSNEEKIKSTGIWYDVRNLLGAVLAYRFIKQREQVSNVELAKLFEDIPGYPPKVLSTVNNAEKTFFQGKPLFYRATGKKSYSLLKDGDAEIEKMVSAREEWLLYTLEQLGVSFDPYFEVGVGLQLTAYHTWVAARKFKRERKDARGSSVDIHIHQAPAEELKRGLKEGKYDIIVTSYDEQEVLKFPDKRTARFPLKLLADRRFSDADEHVYSEVPAAVLQNKRLVTQIKRNPKIDVRPGCIPSGCTAIEAESWPEAFATVLSSENAFGIACPEMLHPRDRTRFKVFDFDGLGSVNVAVEVAPGGRAGQGQPTQEDREALANALAKQLRKSAHCDPNEAVEAWRKKAKANKQLRTAHLTHDVNGDKVLVHGELRDVVVSDDGHLRGDHIFTEPPFAAQQGPLTLKGKITQNSKGQDRYFVTWRAWETGKSEETYTACLSGDSTNFKDVLIGAWTGRSTFLQDQLLGLGLFMVYSAKDRKNDFDLTHDFLDWVLEYEKQRGVELADGLSPKTLFPTPEDSEATPKTLSNELEDYRI